MDPMDVMDAGRMTFFTHPGAGALGVWQAGNHTGAELVNEPVSMAWNELLSRDVAARKAFLAGGIRAGDRRTRTSRA